MKIIVTGGMGFIGSNYVLQMLEHGEEPSNITVIDAMKQGSNEMNLRGSGCNIIKGNICDPKMMKREISNADIIINFAAETHVDRSIANPGSFIESNIMGTYNILEAMRELKSCARFVHISTDEVYGDIEKGSFTENSPLKPSSPYSASKASSDMLVLAYARTYGLNASITRCTNNYGPLQFPEKLIPKTIIRATMNKKIPVYGKGLNVRDWIYVRDHCQAVQLVAGKGKPGEIYNISSGEEKSNISLVKEIMSIMGKSHDMIEFVEDRPGHDIRYSLDSSRIRKLGWKPGHNMSQGIRETVSWYTKNEKWWKPLADEIVLSEMPWKK